MTTECIQTWKSHHIKRALYGFWKLEALWSDSFRVGPCKDSHAYDTQAQVLIKHLCQTEPRWFFFSPLPASLELSRTAAAMDLHWVGHGDDSWLWPTCNKHPSPPTIDTQLMSVQKTWEENVSKSVCSALNAFVSSNRLSLVLSRPVFPCSLSAVSGVTLSYCWRKHNVSCNAAS